MEDTLRVIAIIICAAAIEVLILVLMEDTLRDLLEEPEETTDWSLNPCFNGRYSQSQLQVTSAKTQKS